jgi:hypothetical protein
MPGYVCETASAWPSWSEGPSPFFWALLLNIAEWSGSIIAEGGGLERVAKTPVEICPNFDDGKECLNGS